MHPAHPVQPLGSQYAGALQIALAPAASRRAKSRRTRTFFLGAFQLRRHADAPAGPAQQGCFDEIVTKDGAAERRFASQIGKPSTFHEGANPDDCVMPPEIAVAAMPEGQARGVNRSVEPAGRLPQPGKQGVTVDEDRHALDQAGIGTGFHARSELFDSLGGHQAVGIQHQHVVVGVTPAAAPIADIASLGARIR